MNRDCYVEYIDTIIEYGYLMKKDYCTRKYTHFPYYKYMRVNCFVSYFYVAGNFTIELYV